MFVLGGDTGNLCLTTRLFFGRGADILEESTKTIGLESMRRVRTRSLSFSCHGWLLGYPLPQLNTPQAARVKAARDFSAVEMVEAGSSPVALSIIFAERGTGTELKPNESLVSAMIRQKKRLQPGAVQTKLTVAGINAGRSEEKATQALTDARQSDMKRVFSNMGLAVEKTGEFRDQLSITIEKTSAARQRTRLPRTTILVALMLIFHIRRVGQAPDGRASWSPDVHVTVCPGSTQVMKRF